VGVNSFLWYIFFVVPVPIMVTDVVLRLRPWVQPGLCTLPLCRYCTSQVQPLFTTPILLGFRKLCPAPTKTRVVQRLAVPVVPMMHQPLFYPCLGHGFYPGYKMSVLSRSELLFYPGFQPRLASGCSARVLRRVWFPCSAWEILFNPCRTGSHAPLCMLQLCVNVCIVCA
jgi:hypothetical protein